MSWSGVGATRVRSFGWHQQQQQQSHKCETVVGAKSARLVNAMAQTNVIYRQNMLCDSNRWACSERWRIFRLSRDERVEQRRNHGGTRCTWRPGCVDHWATVHSSALHMLQRLQLSAKTRKVCVCIWYPRVWPILIFLKFSEQAE